ncbi:hypothetical protein AAVH_21350, partial [Aphelenchoides avenae]
MKFLLTAFIVLAMARVAVAATACAPNVPNPGAAPCECGTAKKSCNKGDTCNDKGGATKDGECTPKANTAAGAAQ